MPVRRELGHVGGLAEAPHAAAAGGLDRRRAVGVLGDDVAALVDEGLGGVGLLARVVPGVHPHHLDLGVGAHLAGGQDERSEEHTSELQSLMRSSYAVFCLKKKT